MYCLNRWEIERKLRLARRSAAERGASPSELARRRDRRKQRRAQRAQRARAQAQKEAEARERERTSEKHGERVR